MLGRRIECPIHGTSISVHRLAPDLAIGSVRFIEDSDLRKGNQIGQGGYGLVYKASWNNTPVALKLLIVKVEQASTPWVALCAIVR
jgi:serine/threonine protein kinase